MSAESASARRAIRLFYAFQTSFSLLLWMPIFYDYQKLMGLTDKQIFDIQGAYYFFFFLLEVPTGYLADRFGHRRSMLYGCALCVLSNLIPSFWVTYWGFWTHWVLLAFARSLVSGASSAYLYNYLERLEQTDLYKGAEGNARAYSLVAKVLGFALCGPMMKIAVSMPYLVSAAASALAVLVTLRMPLVAEKRSEKNNPRPSEIVRLLLQSPFLMLLILQGVGIFVLTRIVQVNLFQPVLKERGFDATGFGMVLALNTLFEALGAAYPHLLRRSLSDINAVFLLTASMAVNCILLADSGPQGSVVWLTVFAVLTGLSFPIQRQVLNQAIPDSRYRASLLSAESLVDRAACSYVAARLGGFVAAGQTNGFLRLSGWSILGMVAVLIVLFPLARRRHVVTTGS